MKDFRQHLHAVAIILSVSITSCEIVTEDPPQRILRPAKHLVINEVFTLPENHQRVFSWIELYNPRPDTVNLTGWSLSFATRRWRIGVPFDSTGPIFERFTLLDQKDSVFTLTFGLFDTVRAAGGLPGFRLNGYNFLTIGSSESRLEEYTNLGPGDGPVMYAFPFRIPGTNINIQDPGLVGSFEQTARTDSLVIGFYRFLLKQTDQIILRDANRNIVDIVRYGNYSITAADARPTNRSIGFIPEFQSIARYGGAYFTPDSGNTAEDFYITAIQVPQTRPIPHWVSQAYKQ